MQRSPCGCTTCSRQLTLDLALETFVGVDLTQEEQDQVNKAFIAAVRAGTSIIRKPIPGGPWARGLKARAFLEDFFRSHLPAKRRDGGDDLFAQLCRAQSEDGHEFSDDDIVNHMIFLLMAAHDTTTITMSSMAYHLAKNPDWQERAREESVAAGDVDYDGVLGLEVLDRVMKESMRLCSPVPSLPRVAVRDTALGGYHIPAGSFVTVSPYMNHYLPELWPDPTRFDPDRFAPERREDRSHRMAFEPFGAGVHKCIGMHFAGMQVRAIFHELLRGYRWSVPDDYVWPIDLTALPFPARRRTRDALQARAMTTATTTATTEASSTPPATSSSSTAPAGPTSRTSPAPLASAGARSTAPTPTRRCSSRPCCSPSSTTFLTELDRVAVRTLRRARPSSSASPRACG